ncbi:hypothetical protein VV01_09890 [Luteipulveratus halotolerans]|uniref:SNARE associated Golgi protein n=1 Tax=Luteipulveratus halotolerans TaxID=1631356 RepID=A0A0L6CNM0_9MICO|nr:hypothetical protein VV01_09890 [Luteipulveratus halotolerans]
MLEWIDDQPFGLLVALLFCWIFVRANTIYAVGRAATSGRLGARVTAVTQRPGMQRAQAGFNRVGLAIVPVSFLMAGLTFATQLTAGVMRLPWPRYLLAMIPGCIAWSVLTATVGTLALGAVLRLWDAPLGVRIAVATVVAAAIAAYVVRRRRAPSEPAG